MILLILASLIPISGIQSYRIPPNQYRIPQVRRPSTGILRPFRLKRANIVRKRRVYLYNTSLRQFYRRLAPTIYTFPSGHTMTIIPGR